MIEKAKKKVFLKNIYIVFIIFIGWLVLNIGAFGKIKSEPWGNLLLNYGMFIWIFGCILGIIKVFLLNRINTGQSKPNNVTLKVKYIILFIFTGIIISSFGAIGKINSEPWANMFVTIGSVILFIGFILGIIKILTMKEVRDFLQR